MTLLDDLLSCWLVPVADRPDPEAAFRTVYPVPVPVNGTPMRAGKVGDIWVIGDELGL